MIITACICEFQWLCVVACDFLHTPGWKDLLASKAVTIFISPLCCALVGDGFWLHKRSISSHVMHYQSDFWIGSRGIVDSPVSVLHIWVCNIGSYLLIIAQRKHTSLVPLWAVYFSTHTLLYDPSHHNHQYCKYWWTFHWVCAVWEGGSNVPCNCDWVLVVLSDTGLCVGACSCLRSRTCLYSCVTTTL